MSQLLVNEYLNEIDRLRKFSGSTTEGVISEAFKDLLKAWSRQLGWQFAAQYEFASTQKTRIRPDGTIFHSLGLPFGYWEAKDTDDDLDVEIRKKLAKGYPQGNIVFENSQTAVLIQNRQEVFRCSMTDTAELLKLLNLFFKYERAEIREFRRAVEEFKTYLPHVLEALRARIDTAYSANDDFRAAAGTFLQHAKDTINPTIGEADVREMLIQHILTEEIFANVFNEGDFHRENNIAKELYALEGKFFTGAVKKETLKGLELYYAAIRANAAQISSHAEKQTFLKLIYENFYKVYNPKAADRLGVVYTPHEIVRFMVEGADWLTQKHFGKALIDPHVEILDPATGTGTFICELLEHFRGQPQKLVHKYKNELHANEVAILPYYVANLNIEATYAAISGQFAEYPNLCFVDTLDNVAGLGVRTGQHVGDLFGALSDENIERVKRQNARKISVIIGNPPYNANQQNENDNNKNRDYPHIDGLIKASYVKLSTAQKTKVYDMYARFFRWASDRMHDDGVIAFVTNRSFIESRTFDGFRRAVEQDFNEITIVDLGGDVRANPKLSGTKHNVFGIQTGVAISFLVKRHRQKGCRIFYARRPEMDTAVEKLAFLGSASLSSMRFERVAPDKNANWVNLTENDWDRMIPVADKKTKAAKTKGQERAIFRLYSLGVVTARDEWVYGPSDEEVANKVQFLFDIFSSELDTLISSNLPVTAEALSTQIKWSRLLKKTLESRRRIKFSRQNIVNSSYRPFVRRYLYFDKFINEMLYQVPLIFDVNYENCAIIASNGKRAEFAVLSSHIVPSLDTFVPDPTTIFPRYRYQTSGECIDNITDWALRKFRNAYRLTSSGALMLRQDPNDDADDSPIADDSAEAPPSALPGISPSRGEIGRAGRARQIGKDDIFHYV